MKFKILLVLTVLNFANSLKSYENYKVYNVIPKSEENVQMLVDLQKEGYDFWTDVFKIGDEVRVMIAPDQDQDFVRYSKQVGMEPVISIPNVQKLMNEQLRSANNGQRSATLGSFSWDRYHNIQEIHAWLDELVVLYPNVVRPVVIGTSLEGREIKGVIINHRSEVTRPLIGMIEGGIHSREWISPATVTWIVKEFLTSNDPAVRSMAENFEWHIFPVVNPDGYAYTFNGDRMWRKNRNPVSSGNCTGGNNDLSNGIDLNRNFNYLWMTTGASSNPCSQTYAGPSGGSELEAQAISNYVLQLRGLGNFIYYFAFHSYSQLILVPYSHVGGADVLEAENYADMYEIAIRGVDTLTATHGTTYNAGTSADVLYEVSGSSFDWVKGVADIPIVYLFELRDVGEYGFLLPPEQIIPNNEEIMNCLVEMDRVTMQLGYYFSSASTITPLLSLAITIGFLILFQ